LSRSATPPPDATGSARL